MSTVLPSSVLITARPLVTRKLRRATAVVAFSLRLEQLGQVDPQYRLLQVKPLDGFCNDIQRRDRGGQSRHG